MSKNIRTQIGKIVGKTLNDYHQRVKPKIDDLKFKEQYQGRIIDCMVGEVDDNYIETPETDAPVVKLEHSKEGLVKVPSIKGKTILVDSDGNETDTPGEGCRLVSVGEEEDNKLIILSKNEDNSLSHKTEILLKEPLREGDYIEGKKIYRNVKQDGLTLIPLEEPIIEELPNSITLQGFDNTTMYIENSITPTVKYGYNALIPYKQELLNQKEEVETNTLDIEQNIIPYLMDMEFNLMLMEDNE